MTLWGEFKLVTYTTLGKAPSHVRGLNMFDDYRAADPLFFALSLFLVFGVDELFFLALLEKATLDHLRLVF